MINSIRFGGNIRICILSRNHVFCQKFFPIGITQHLSHETPGWQPRLIVNESDGVHGRVRAAASLCFVLAAQARKLSLSASFRWAEEAQKTPRTEQRRRCYHRNLVLSSFSVASLGCRGTWPIELVAKLSLRPP